MRKTGLVTGRYDLNDANRSASGSAGPPKLLTWSNCCHPGRLDRRDSDVTRKRHANAEVAPRKVGAEQVREKAGGGRWE